jgi:hypothetical protein
MPASAASIAFAGLALLALVAVPAVAAEGQEPGYDCTTVTVGQYALVLAEAYVGPSCGVGVLPYTCDVEWYGGHGLLGGFIFTCTPGLREPCVWPVCP